MKRSVIFFGLALLAQVAALLLAQWLAFDKILPVALSGAGLMLVLWWWLIERRDRALLARFEAEIDELASQRTAPPPAPLPVGLASDEIDVLLAKLYRFSENLVGSNRNIRKVAENLVDWELPTVFFTSSGIVFWQNAAAAALFGRDTADRKLIESLPDPRLPEALASTLALRKRRLLGEVEFPRANRWFTVLLNPIDLGDRFAGIALFYDVTGTHLQGTQSRNLIADVSHELRSPLTSISGFLETIDDINVSEQDRGQIMKILRHQVRRMVRIVEDLLNLSSLEVGQDSAEVHLVNLTEVVRAEVASFSKKARRKNQALKLVLPEENLIIVAPELHLDQVVHNLLDNAIKYGRSSKGVEISLAKTTDAKPGAILTIRDHGEGVAEQHLPHLTSRFYRVDRDRSRETGGTGLGLAIVRKIVENCGGTLEIHSTLGRGTRIRVGLPLLDEESLDEQAS